MQSLLIRLGLALGLLSSPALAAQVTLIISDVPANTPPGATITLGANINDWKPDNPAYRFGRNENGVYGLNVQVPNGSTLECKVTLGSWETVEKAADGSEMPNRMLRVLGDTSLDFKVARWAGMGAAPVAAKSSTLTGRIERLENVVSPQLENARNLIVYLPPSYAASSERRYPVLYAQDGQNLFDAATSFAGEWGADETAEALARRGLEAIIVGIPNMGVERMAEYSPFPDPETRMVARGEAYAAFLTLTVKPLIDARYRTLADRQHTGLVGSSMGGLISLYTGLRFPETYGFVGAMSPSFWIGNYSMVNWVKTHPNPGVRVWIDMGTEEGAGMLLGARWLADLLTTQGNEVRLTIEPGAKHNEAAWRARFPAVLEWFHATPAARVATDAAAMLEKAVVAHGGAAFKALGTLRLKMVNTQYVQSPNGPAPTQSFEVNALLETKLGRIRVEYLDGGRIVLIQQVSVPTREAFVWTVDRGTQRVPYEVLSGLAMNLFSGITGLASGAERREAALIRPAMRLLDFTGQGVGVTTNGVYAEYLFGQDGTLLAECLTIPGGNAQTNVYRDYRTISGVKFPFEIAGYLDLALISMFKVLSVEINPSFGPDAFRLP